MLTKLTLRNFRGFDNHSMNFAPLTVAVGQNNAGKTTVVEALRLVSIVALRYRHLGFHHPPGGSDIPLACIGVKPSLRDIEINFETIFHQYRDPPGIIEAKFSNGTSIRIYITDKEQIHAVIRDGLGQIVHNKGQANRIEVPPIRIMPQVAPLQREETILSADYVRSSMSSRLAPLHFRNQLNIHYDIFESFRQLVQETWPGVQIRELVGQGDLPGNALHLLVRNEDFVAEVADMGHGLQMWLQTMWFLTLSAGAPTMILDEPDVYMHADLQRRIIRFLRSRHEQVIVTTHSVEIMSEVEPEEILVIDKGRPESSFAGSIPVVQRAISQFGSVHNIHLARLLNARKFLLLEGKDLKFLKVFQDILFPDSARPLRGLPQLSIGGWTGWKLAIGSSLAFKNSLGETIRTYCILDSDFHSQTQVEARYREAVQHGIDLHIWLKKEIENYLLSPSVISRVITKGGGRRTSLPTQEEIQAVIVKLADGMKDEVLDAIATEVWSNDRHLGQTGANREARKRIQEVRQSTGSILDLVSGKDLLTKLSEWSQTEFGVSFGSVTIAREMQLDEIDPEVRSVLTAIENGNTLNG